MHHDALDVPRYAADRNLHRVDVHRQHMGGSDHPLRRDQHAVPFAGHVDERGKLGRRDPVLGVIDVIPNDDGTGGGRGHEQQEQQESDHLGCLERVMRGLNRISNRVGLHALQALTREPSSWCFHESRK